MNPHYALISYDWHCGADGAIVAPGTKIKVSAPGKSPTLHTLELTNFQGKLWNLSRNALDATKQIIGKSPISIIQGGDIVAGNTIPGEPLMMACTSISNQYRIATAFAASMIYELEQNIVDFWAASGTPAHSGNEGDAEQQVSIGIEALTGVPCYAVNHGIVEIGGARLDIAHHGPSVGKNWTHGDPLRAYLKRAMMDDMDTLGYPLPATAYFRGHVHSYAHTEVEIERRGKFYESEIFVVPSLYMMNGYARKVSRSMSYTRHGFVLIEIIGDKIARHWQFMETYDVRRVMKSSGVIASVRKGAGNYSKGDGQMP